MTPRGKDTVLALNCGSSSLKFGLFSVDGVTAAPLIEGEAEAIGTGEAAFSAKVGDHTLIADSCAIASHAEALTRVVDLLAEQNAPSPAAVGHRIVHGGPFVRDHCLIEPSVFQALEQASMLAPLHAPAALDVVRLAQARYRDQPHIACLDTAFHRDLPDVARHFPISAALTARGIQRYGFHGLSCESILRQLGDAAPERMVIAHLGSGSSVTAVRAGRSIDTSMGLTPTGGVMMATRSGDLDPGLLIYLIRERNLDAAQLESVVNHTAGLAGVSGLSGDMRRLRAAEGDANARLAVDMFVYSVRKQIAAMTAALEGLDLLVFTGGIGERDASTRGEICAGLTWLGIGCEKGPAMGDNPSGDQAQGSVRVLPAREEVQIARHAWDLANG